VAFIVAAPLWLACGFFVRRLSVFREDVATGKAAALRRNERWLKSKIAQGYEIFTVGSKKGMKSSDFFDLENKILRDAGITPKLLPGF
jgi:hypothetical protein